MSTITSVIPAPRRASRSLAVDLFRGIALLTIVVDHIGGSILSRVTLHSFSFADAAEAFVFLSGYALAGSMAASNQCAPIRPFKRVWPVYRAFLLCAGLMLATAALLQSAGLFGPNLPIDALERFIEAPTVYLVDLLLMREQPYLASVLPMYLVFLFAAPAFVPFAVRRPLVALGLSTLLWYFAPEMGAHLPGGADTWSFNPFAWQWMFMMGAVGQSAMVQRVFAEKRWRFGLSIGALAIVLACAVWRLAVEPGYLDPLLKQNLNAIRVLNFVALAWLVGTSAQAGWIDAVRGRVRWLVTVGRVPLPSFIAGALISLVLDTCLYHASAGRLDYAAGLLTDAAAILLAIGFALGFARLKTQMPGFSPRHAPILTDRE